MLKPQMPNIPGVGAMTDTLDFVKNLWGSMSVPGVGIPGVTAPSMSVEDLDKKIADLKAVEAWLNVNATMVRGTIQALESQRGTIATLKSMGATLANAVKQPGANEKSVLAAAPYASAFFSQPAAEAPAPAPTPAAAPAPAPAKVEAKPAEAAAEGAANPAAAMTNPAAWWNLLQDQFKQAVTTAMSSDAMASAAALAQGAAAKGLNAAAGKPIAKVASKTKDEAVEKAPARKRVAAKPKAGKAE